MASAGAARRNCRRVIGDLGHRQPRRDVGDGTSSATSSESHQRRGGVMHALELIEREYRFTRYLSLERLRKHLGREKGHCTWCNKTCSRRWCSVSCHEEGYIRSGFIQGQVEHRDKGICALCGFDTLAIQARVKRILRRSKDCHNPHAFRRIREFMRRTNYYSNGTPYEIDHVTPIIEGGGCCGLDNLRTLCFTCHKAQTKALAKRRAAKRNDEHRTLFAVAAGGEEE